MKLITMSCAYEGYHYELCEQPPLQIQPLFFAVRHHAVRAAYESEGACARGSKSKFE